MKKRIQIILLVLCCNLIAFAQNFKSHKVQEGETIESIAKQYNVTPYDIYTLNPDAKTKFKSSMVLIIPDAKTYQENITTEIKEFTGYETHKVKRKETLYSIAKEYNIEVEDIKKHNKELYADNLKKGSKIRIPRFKTVVTTTPKPVDSTKIYVVQPKEGKWRVAYKFGITVDELSALNPDMNEVLQPGDQLKVPKIETKDEKPVEPNFDYYEVLPKEGFYRLKIKLGLSQEELEQLNPGLKESGLKSGMILRVPLNAQIEEGTGEVNNTQLATKLTNFKTKKIALMMPFKLHKIDVDSVAEAKAIVRADKMISVSLDFHSGVLMALDSAKRLGISTNLKVFDTQNQEVELSRILRENDFSSYDAIVGPVLAKSFEKVASQMKADNVPAISPFMKVDNLYDNVFQTIPNDDMLEQTIINYIKKDSLNSRVVIISDEKNRSKSNRIKGEFPNAKQVFSKKNKDGRDSYYVNAESMTNMFSEGKTYVFLETSNAGLALNVTSLLNGLVTPEHDLILVTTNKNDAFDNEHVSNFHLAKLKFHYPSIHKAFDSDISNDFVNKYKREYGYEPNKYAVRGFDLMLDLLLRLASSDNLYSASTSDIETEYIENKFRYSKKLMGGFYNEAVYVLQYTADLKIQEVKQ